MANLSLYNNGVLNVAIMVMAPNNATPTPGLVGGVATGSTTNPTGTQNDPMLALRLLLRCFKKATISEENPNGLDVVWAYPNTGSPGTYIWKTGSNGTTVTQPSVNHRIYLQPWAEGSPGLGATRCYNIGNDIYLEYSSSADTWAAVWAVMYFCEQVFDAKILWPGWYGTVVYPKNNIVASGLTDDTWWEWINPVEHFHIGNTYNHLLKEFCIPHGAQTTDVNNPTSSYPLNQECYEKNYTSKALPVRVRAVTGTSVEIPAHPCSSPFSISKRFPHLSGKDLNGNVPNAPGQTQKADIVTIISHNPLYKRFESPIPVKVDNVWQLRDPNYNTVGHPNFSRIIPAPSLEQVYFHDWVVVDRCGELLDEYHWTMPVPTSGTNLWSQSGTDAFSHNISTAMNRLVKPVRLYRNDQFVLRFDITRSSGTGTVSVLLKNLSIISVLGQTEISMGSTLNLGPGAHSFTFTYSGADTTTYLVFEAGSDFIGSVTALSLRKTNFATSPSMNLFPIDGGNYTSNMIPVPARFAPGGSLYSVENLASWRKAVYYASVPDPSFQSAAFNAEIKRMNLGEFPNSSSFNYTKYYIAFYKRVEAYFAFMATTYISEHPDPTTAAAITAQVRARAAACRFNIYIYHRYTYFPTGLRVDLSKFDAYITGNAIYSQTTIRNIHAWIESGIKIHWRTNIFFAYPIAPYNGQKVDCEIWEALRTHPVNAKRAYLDGYIDSTLHSAQPLYFYTVARMFRNPNMTYDEIQNEFYSCFGAAKETMRRYMDRCIELSRAAKAAPLYGFEKNRDMPVSVRYYNAALYDDLQLLLPSLDSLPEKDDMSIEEQERYDWIRQGLNLAINAYKVYSPITSPGHPWRKITSATFVNLVKQFLTSNFPKDPTITVTIGAGANATTSLANGFGFENKIDEAAGIITIPNDNGTIAPDYFSVAFITCTDIGQIGYSAELKGVDPTSLEYLGYGSLSDISFQNAPTLVTSDITEASDITREIAEGSFSIGARWPDGTVAGNIPYTTLVVREAGTDRVLGVFLLGSLKSRPIKGSFFIEKKDEIGVVMADEAFWVSIEEQFYGANIFVPHGGTTVRLTPWGGGGTENIIHVSITDEPSIILPTTTKVYLSSNVTGTYYEITTKDFSTPGTIICTMPTSVPIGNLYSIKVVIPVSSTQRSLYAVSTTNVTINGA